MQYSCISSFILCTLSSLFFFSYSLQILASILIKVTLLGTANKHIKGSGLHDDNESTSAKTNSWIQSCTFKWWISFYLFFFIFIYLSIYAFVLGKEKHNNPANMTYHSNLLAIKTELYVQGTIKKITIYPKNSDRKPRSDAPSGITQFVPLQQS